MLLFIHDVFLFFLGFSCLYIPPALAVLRPGTDQTALGIYTRHDLVRIDSPVLSVIPRPGLKWAALGDSFAAGIGAGSIEQYENEDYWCSRYNASYASQWNLDMEAKGYSNISYQHLACTGATISDVHDQLASLTGEEDFVTLTISGNDLHFSSILDRCIFRWSDGWRGPCDEIFFNETINAATDGTLHDNLKDLMGAIVKNSSNIEFILFVTGYPKFFNDRTTQCDNVTFTYWSHLDRQPQYLTQSHRSNLNKLVYILNGEIERAVKSTRGEHPNATVLWVDYNGYFSMHGFCEEGVEEPDPDNPELWFFNWYTTEDMPPQPDPPLDGDGLPLRQNALVQEISDWIELAKEKSPRIRASAMAQRRSVLPDSSVRVFHPRVPGHMAIMRALEAADAVHRLKEKIRCGSTIRP